MSAHQFKAGDPVVCINDSGRSLEAKGWKFPRQNIVYTVREVVAFPKAIVLLLVEIRNRKIETVIGFREPGFQTDRFRPVQKRATDISVFQSLLTPSPYEIAEVQLEDSVAEFEELVHLGEGLLK